MNGLLIIMYICSAYYAHRMIYIMNVITMYKKYIVGLCEWFTYYYVYMQCILCTPDDIYYECNYHEKVQYHVFLNKLMILISGLIIDSTFIRQVDIILNVNILFVMH